MAFWIEDAELGRVTLGHYEMAGAVNTIDLGGISAGASPSLALVNGSFLLRGPVGQYYTVPWKALVDPAANRGRQNELRYDSTAIMGFIFSSSIAEDGSNWGTMLRYANDFSSVRVAARADCLVISGVCVNPPGSGPANLDNPAPNVNSWGAGSGTRHVGLHHPGIAGEERRGSCRRPQPDRPVGRRCEAREACEICLRLPRMSAEVHAEPGLARGEDTSWATPAPAPDSEPPQEREGRSCVRSRASRFDLQPPNLDQCHHSR